MSAVAARPGRLVTAAALVVMLLAASLGSAAPAQAQQSPWAPAAQATIRPGVQTFTAGAQCTANFVFVSATAVFLGQAAHCSGTGGPTDVIGCVADSLPLGTEVDIQGASRPGTLVYNSWIAMRNAGETDPNACTFNDFALVRVDPADRDKVNPSVPVFGGPDGLNTDGTGIGELVYSYGNSSLRLGLELLSPKIGISLGTQGSGWTHQVLTVTPGIPGDSGSAFLDSDGNALGVVSTLMLLPLAGTNGVSDLRMALDYLRASTPTLADVQLAPGTEPFAF